MKGLFFLLLCCYISVYAQSRNVQVRTLNQMVDYMDESSRINMVLYWDLKQFAEGYIHSSGEKKNNNYWWTHSSPTGSIGPFNDDKGRFPELHVNEKGMICDFEYVLYPYLVARETMDKLLTTQFFLKKDSLKNSFLAFKSTIDTLVVFHKNLYDYVNSKAYVNDVAYKMALGIIQKGTDILDRYYIAAKKLYTDMQSYYQTYLPPLKTQKKAIAGEKEIAKTMDLLNSWELALYNGNNSVNTNNDLTMHQLNDEGLQKDSLLFYGTYGYKNSNNGAMPHTRYCTFYEMMKPTIYWYVKDKYDYPGYMTSRDINYNEYAFRYNQVVEDYNDFIECADGRQLSANMDYSMKMAAGLGVDTNQNVLLKKPRLGFLFHFVKKEEKVPVVQEVIKDTVLTEHQQLINNSLPHHMVFLLDVSTSMHDPGKLDLLKNGTKYLVSLQRNKDHISLLTFSTHSHTLLRNTPCDFKEQINTKIDELHTYGATNASDGIRHAFDIADSNLIATGRNKIILVTDGKFQLDGDAIKLLTRFKKKHIELVIFLVGKDEPTLENDFTKLAQKGNGRFYKVAPTNLENILVKEASD